MKVFKEELEFATKEQATMAAQSLLEDLKIVVILMRVFGIVAAIEAVVIVALLVV